ncbi:hypothetical protein RF11_15053 [Thelohanellus kitauei]|uniref:Uncharacterized protein n=1 Tax=Thelohanellus kitauei TaxID=669202 RepID=A0A0C2IET5_THEKT|nr:hypothetical protein RF11_15053 [Thelohanellus kitauei]
MTQQKKKAQVQTMPHTPYIHRIIFPHNFMVTPKYVHETMSELRKSSLRTLIIEESTDIFFLKMLILYFKYRAETELIYKTIFGRIVKLVSHDHIAHQLSLENIIVSAILKREIHHLCELHCVAHRKDLAVEDALKKIPLMIEIETFLRTVYTIFSRSSVNNEKFQESAKAAESDVIAFRVCKK